LLRIVASTTGERAWAADFCICIGAAAALAMLHWVRPLGAPWFPSCPLHAIGILCPGCGTLRAIDSLLNGNLMQAIAYNVLFMGFMPWFMLWTGNLALTALVGRRIGLRRQPAFLGWAILAAVLVFFLLRNIPHETLAWLRPHQI